MLHFIIPHLQIYAKHVLRENVILLPYSNSLLDECAYDETRVLLSVVSAPAGC